MMHQPQTSDPPATGFAPAWCQMSHAACKTSGVSDECRGRNPDTQAPSPDWDIMRLRAASRAAGIGLWEWNLDSNIVNMDGDSCALWGIFGRSAPNFEMLATHVVAPDRPRLRNAIRAARRNPGPYEIEFRILHDGAVRWIAARGLGAEEGIVGRTMFGVFLDVTARRRSEEARELLADEMSHRVKNLFAVAGSLTAIAARSATTTADMAQDLMQRLASLGRAQDLIRADKGAGARAALLTDLLAVFLSPYDDLSRPGSRIRFSLPYLRIGEAACTSLALVFHELATNSVKYGALSSVHGSLEINAAEDAGAIAINWLERGGPTVRAPATRTGFGSKLITRSMVGQLGGAASFDWQPAGLVVALQASLGRLRL